MRHIPPPNVVSRLSEDCHLLSRVCPSTFGPSEAVIHSRSWERQGKEVPADGLASDLPLSQGTPSQALAMLLRVNELGKVQALRPSPFSLVQPVLR